MKNNRLSLLIKGSALVLTISLLPGCKGLDFFKKKDAAKFLENKPADFVNVRKI